MKNKKSTTLLMISLALLMILGSTTFSIIYIVNTIQNDAESINDAGIIRGSIQRLAKLESNKKENDESIHDIEKRIETFSTMANEIKNKNMKKCIKALDEEWLNLCTAIYEYRKDPSQENKEALLSSSEKLWTNTNDIVYETQIMSENKVNNFKLVLPFMVVNLVILLFLIYAIKNYVRDELENAVSHDPLTKIYNRHFYQESLRQEIDRAKRYENPFSLILFDIDHFKKVNDTFGHDVGDYVLKEVSRVIQEAIRNTDVLARIGGEEFAIIAPETDINSGISLAEKLRKKIESHIFSKADHITISFGVSEYKTSDSIDDIFKRADTALYKAKNSGRNRVESE